MSPIRNDGMTGATRVRRRPATLAALCAPLLASGCIYSDEPFISASDTVYPMAEKAFLVCGSESKCSYSFFKKVNGGYQSYSWNASKKVFVKEGKKYRFRKFPQQKDDIYLGQENSGSQYRLFLLIAHDKGYRAYVPPCDDDNSAMMAKLDKLGVSKCKITPGTDPMGILGRWKSVMGEPLHATYTIYPVKY